jgi:TPP-dependent pyruvate/acetoin dehydrogenase alpha subunit
MLTTIGDASTSEGHFWETINAAAVQQIPLAVFIWDDGYGISVPKIPDNQGLYFRSAERISEKDGTQVLKFIK